MTAATMIEKLPGMQLAGTGIYHSAWFVILWGVMSILAVACIVKRHKSMSPLTIVMHLSFIVILAGAFITHTTSMHGQIHLRVDETSGKFTTNGGEIRQLPFNVTLNKFEIDYYPGTETQMNYKSFLSFQTKDKKSNGEISMNHIYNFNNYRFYQSAYDSDGKGSILAISYDPYGIAITYTGYALLIATMTGLLVNRRGRWQNLIRKLNNKSVKLAAILALMIIPVGANATSVKDRTIPKETAEAIGNLYTLYNGRICPLQTLAKDFSLKLYGTSHYKGLMPEQVLAGWLIYPAEWNEDRKPDRNAKKESQKMSLIESLYAGRLLKIFPYKAQDGLKWFSQGDNLPDKMPVDVWTFVRKSPDYLQETILKGNYNDANKILRKIRKYQQKTAGSTLPPEQKFIAEKTYNAWSNTRLLSIICIITGFILYIYYLFNIISNKEGKHAVWMAASIIWAILFIFLTLQIALRGYIAGHIPMSDGYETMQIMAWITLLATGIAQRKIKLFYPLGLLLGGFALLVSMLGESDPPVTQLSPVLMSPLLSSHVTIIMTAYALLGFLFLNGITAIIIHSVKRENERQIERLTDISRIILYPAVFCLATGIFIGAVWANVSWGQYWSWDPKETWALITMLIYAFAFHQNSIKHFNNPLFFHCYMTIAFLSVLVTYFGVNFILGGMHSYA
jgi:ABC-type transport system involved in cytochrome c biogenesis permease subunit